MIITHVHVKPGGQILACCKHCASVPITSSHLPTTITRSPQVGEMLLTSCDTSPAEWPFRDLPVIPAGGSLSTQPALPDFLQLLSPLTVISAMPFIGPKSSPLP